MSTPKAFAIMVFLGLWLFEWINFKPHFEVFYADSFNKHTTTFPTLHLRRAFSFSAGFTCGISFGDYSYSVRSSGRHFNPLGLGCRGVWSPHLFILLCVASQYKRAPPTRRDISFSFEDCEYSNFSGVLFRPSEPKLIHTIPLKGTKGKNTCSLVHKNCQGSLFIF